MRISLIVLLALVGGGRCFRYNQTSAQTSKNVTPNALNLIESLRRQLMENNYDYEPSMEAQHGLPRTSDTASQARDTNDWNSQADTVDDKTKDSKNINYNAYGVGNTNYDDLNNDKKEELSVNKHELQHKSKNKKKNEQDHSLKNNQYQENENETKQHRQSNSYHNTYGRLRARDDERETTRGILQNQVVIKGDIKDLNSRIDRIHNMVDKIEYMPPYGREFSKPNNNLPKYERVDFNGPEFRSKNRNDSKEKQLNHTVSKKDLLYYLDDNRLTRRNYQPGADDLDYDEMETTELEEDRTTSPKVKYKLLQIRERHPTRRNMQIRRFVEERANDGVTFIKLDREPFPEFRLPRSRRQYMANEDYHMGDGVRSHGEVRERNDEAADAIISKPGASYIEKETKTEREDKSDEIVGTRVQVDELRLKDGQRQDLLHADNEARDILHGLDTMR